MRRWLLVPICALMMPACDRGDEVNAVYPNPDVGVSETESVGNRGTEVGGFFDRNLPRARERDESHRGVPTELARAVQAMGARVISDEVYDWRASPPPTPGINPTPAAGVGPTPEGPTTSAPLR